MNTLSREDVQAAISSLHGAIRVLEHAEHDEEIADAAEIAASVAVTLRGSLGAEGGSGGVGVRLGDLDGLTRRS